MPFKRYVQIGRVALVNYGPDQGKLCTIIDVLDSNKCLVDAPSDVGLRRQVINFRRISLTDLTVKIERNARQKTVKKAFEEGEIKAKWEGSAWASKLAKQQVRAKLNDFDRFKLMVARKQKAVIVNKKVKALKKSA